MFVTQRGWLYAIPAALVLLWHWREKYFREIPIVSTRRDLSAPAAASAEAAANAGAKRDDSETQSSVAADDVGGATAVNACSNGKGPLPFWVELSLYASLPLFHVHTFIALTIVLVISLFFERLTWPKIFSEAPMRRHATTVLSAALIPATFFVWLVTDRFHAKSMVKWHPGWVQDSADFGAPFFRMGGAANFGSATAFGSLLAKDMEWRNRTVLSVLANELWLMGPACDGIGSAIWLARLENRLALGYETAGGRRVRAACGCDLCHWVLRSNRAVGLG